ncbi:MAG: amino acid permease, partial [Oligoflexales bacterium]|nr:amino acid permease [Oligoflexales bacterium]
GNIESAFSIIKILAILIFSIIGIFIWTGFIGSEGFIGMKYIDSVGSIDGLFPVSCYILLQRMIMILVNFQGIEIVAISAAETEDPEKVIPRAIGGVTLRIIMAYIIPVAIILLIMPSKDAVLNESVFVTALSRHGFGTAGAIFAFVIVSAAISCANTGIYSATRAMYSLAGEKLAPSRFTNLNRNAIPFSATIFTLAVMWLFIPMFFLLQDTALYKWLLATAGFTGSICWVSISLCQIKLRKKMKSEGRSANDLPFKFIGYPWLSYFAFIIQTCCLVMVAFSDDLRSCLYLGIPAVFIPMAAVYLVNRKTNESGINPKPLYHFLMKLQYRGAEMVGAENIPKSDPVIFSCGPHTNNMMDGALVYTFAPRRVDFLVTVGLGGPVKFLMDFCNVIGVSAPWDIRVLGRGRLRLNAEGMLEIFNTDQSLRFDAGYPCVAFYSVDGYTKYLKISDIREGNIVIPAEPLSDDQRAMMNARADGYEYWFLPEIEMKNLYTTCIERLADNICVGLLPEGRSHSKPFYLPLKSGVASMYFQALEANPKLKLRIVPVGLPNIRTHGYKALWIAQFGKPLEIAPDLFEHYKAGGERRKKAIKTLMRQIESEMTGVSLVADSFEELEAAGLVRRIVRHELLGGKGSLKENLDLTRRILAEKMMTDPKWSVVKNLTSDYIARCRKIFCSDLEIEIIENGNGFMPFIRSLAALLLISPAFLLALVMNAPLILGAYLYERYKCFVYSRIKRVTSSFKGSYSTYRLVGGIYGFLVELALIALAWSHTGSSATVLQKAIFLAAAFAVSLAVDARLPWIYKHFLRVKSKAVSIIYRRESQNLVAIRREIRKFSLLIGDT